MHLLSIFTYSDFWLSWRGVMNFSLLHAPQLRAVFWCSAKFAFNTNILHPLLPPGKKTRCFSRWFLDYAVAYEFESGFMLLSPAWMHDDDNSHRRNSGSRQQFAMAEDLCRRTVRRQLIWGALCSAPGYSAGKSCMMTGPLSACACRAQWEWPQGLVAAMVAFSAFWITNQAVF